jgi:hypothetical protein
MLGHFSIVLAVIARRRAADLDVDSYGMAGWRQAPTGPTWPLPRTLPHRNSFGDIQLVLYTSWTLIPRAAVEGRERRGRFGLSQAHPL